MYIGAIATQHACLKKQTNKQPGTPENKLNLKPSCTRTRRKKCITIFFFTLFYSLKPIFSRRWGQTATAHSECQRHAPFSSASQTPCFPPPVPSSRKTILRRPRSPRTRARTRPRFCTLSGSDIDLRMTWRWWRMEERGAGGAPGAARDGGCTNYSC